RARAARDIGPGGVVSDALGSPLDLFCCGDPEAAGSRPHQLPADDLLDPPVRSRRLAARSRANRRADRPDRRNDAVLLAAAERADLLASPLITTRTRRHPHVYEVGNPINDRAYYNPGVAGATAVTYLGWQGWLFTSPAACLMIDGLLVDAV